MVNYNHLKYTRKQQGQMKWGKMALGRNKVREE